MTSTAFRVTGLAFEQLRRPSSHETHVSTLLKYVEVVPRKNIPDGGLGGA